MVIISKMVAAINRRIEHATAQARQNAENLEDITNAIVELGELFAEQDDALVELAEIIAE